MGWRSKGEGGAVVKTFKTEKSASFRYVIMSAGDVGCPLFFLFRFVSSDLRFVITKTTL